MLEFLSPSFSYTIIIILSAIVLQYFIYNLLSNCSKHYYHFIQLTFSWINSHIYWSTCLTFFFALILFVPSELKLLFTGVYPLVVILERFCQWQIISPFCCLKMSFICSLHWIIVHLNLEFRSTIIFFHYFAVIIPLSLASAFVGEMLFLWGECDFTF